MAKNRYVDTKFWDDSFIVELSPQEKLLFLYLITNPLTNVVGIYEISLRRISFDTGITVEGIREALKGFERVGKVYYKENHIILTNFVKNQKLNPNIQKGIVKCFEELPEIVKTFIFNDLDKAFKGLLKALKGFEISLYSYSLNSDSNLSLDLSNKKKKKEKNKVSEKIDFFLFWELYDKKVGSKEKIERKWNKLSLKNQEAIIEYIPEYIKAQPDKQYRKNPETFLNNKSWEDEIIIPIKKLSKRDANLKALAELEV